MKGTYAKEAKIFKALADEKRLYILSLLQNGEQCACVLIEKTNISQSSLSYHMKILCDAGLVSGRPDGKWIHYSICCEGCEAAASLLLGLTVGKDTSQKGRCACK